MITTNATFTFVVFLIDVFLNVSLGHGSFYANLLFYIPFMILLNKLPVTVVTGR